MFHSRSRPSCRVCNRNLPRAASRCPWCKTPRPRGGPAGHFPVFNRTCDDIFNGFAEEGR